MPRTFTIVTLSSLRVQARWSAVITFFFLNILIGGIYLPELLRDELPRTRWAFAFLAIGPAIGVLAMAALRRSPAAGF